MDSPMTNECDALREENEMLAAENRRLHNEINELRRVPNYPEAAVRAVWEHGRDAEQLNWRVNSEDVARIFTEALQK